MFRKLTDRIFVSPQISIDQVAEAKAQGVTVIINNRPDDEEPGQVNGAEIEADDPARAGTEVMSGVYSVTPRGRSTAELLEIGEGFAVIRLRWVWSFPDSYHVGVFTGAALGVFSLEPSILVRSTSLCDAELLISWTVPEGGLRASIPE